MKIDTSSNNTMTATITPFPIFQIRTDKGWSQVKLARKMGVKQSSVARAERNERQGNPSISFYDKAAKAMGYYLEIKLRDKNK